MMLLCVMSTITSLITKSISSSSTFHTCVYLAFLHVCNQCNNTYCLFYDHVTIPISMSTRDSCISLYTVLDTCPQMIAGP